MEESNEVTVRRAAFKYGVINGLIGIIFFVIVDFAGLAGNQNVSWIGLIFSAVLIYLAQKEFLKGGDGFMSYGEGLGIGTLLSFIGGLISGIFTFLYITFINTEFVKAIREKAIMDMEEQGMSDSQIDQAMGITESFTSPAALMIFGILGAVFFGFLISLIISAINKKSRPEFQ